MFQSVPELYPEEIEEYNSICRAEVITSYKLKCHYVHYNKPYLWLAPFKLEELNIEPPIVLFHNVISDEEIKHMKNASAEYVSYSTKINHFICIYVGETVYAKKVVHGLCTIDLARNHRKYSFYFKKATLKREKLITFMEMKFILYNFLGKVDVLLVFIGVFFMAYNNNWAVL